MGYQGYDRGRGPNYRDDPPARERQDWRGGGRPDRVDRERYEAQRGYHDRGREAYGARGHDDDHDRGFFDRAGDEVRSWFGDEEAERRRRYDERMAQREYEERWGRECSAPDQGRQGRSDRSFNDSFAASYGLGGLEYGAGARETWPARSGDGRHDHDPNYRAWRDQQLAALDRDYEEYRREHQSKFDQHFGEWRQHREGQRQSLRQVQPHQDVVGSDGQHVGKVDAVKGDRIVLAKNDSESGGRHHEIPCSWIQRVSERVELNRSHDQVQAAWRDVEHDDRGRGMVGGGDRHQSDDGTGPHVLNRSFSGTY